MQSLPPSIEAIGSQIDVLMGEAAASRAVMEAFMQAVIAASPQVAEAALRRLPLAVEQYADLLQQEEELTRLTFHRRIAQATELLGKLQRGG